jgi:adenosine deaminase
LGESETGAPAAIWARRQVAVESCPTSYITAESIALLEEFHAWKLVGVSDVYQLPARVVEAIFILENELRSEKHDASS